MEKLITLLIFLISIGAFSQQAFDCTDGNFYQVISGSMKAYDPITGSYSEALHSYASYNAGGYNSVDNYLYAIKNNDKHLLRIGKDMVVDLGAVMPAGNIAFGGGYAADIDPEGNLWVFQNNNKKTFHKITNLKNYNNTSAPIFEVVEANEASPSNCADIVYINGSFYGGSRGKLYRWDLSTGIPVFSYKTVTNLPNATFGAAYTDANHRLYLSDNNGGLYLINNYQNTPTAVLLNLTETTNSNDGFKCANGISPLDKDRDGILDSMDSDCDGDGILNIAECNGIDPYGDIDDDGLANYLDNDVSGNGDNVVQDFFDRDGDGFPDFLDVDSDNDGIYDIVEAGHGNKDQNNDGVYNSLDANFLDNDLDGLADTFDADQGGNSIVLIDTDNDGIYDCYDIDSDNDGIVDIIEGQNAQEYLGLSNQDTDKDGMDDSFDPDNDGTTNGITNTDGSDTYDYLDTDSNNNGISDQVEAYDADNDGIAETIASGSDDDLDGLDNNFDLKKTSFDPENGGQNPSSFPIPEICDRYNYLGEFTSDGTPLYLEQRDVISEETINKINNALPESYPVPDFNPHYISSGYDTDIKLNATAEVWITFVGEGAGYKNTLGFYTYDITTPLQSVPAPEDITIVFPNISAVESGGGLEVGDKVKIGSFPPNTGIGWVLLANSWSEGCVGTGNWQLYSESSFNPESDLSLRSHNILLEDTDNEKIVLGFEDIRRDYASCDEDFNDALFYITASPYTAITNTNFVSIEEATDVTSANDGGLESNGDLAKLIAKRNFNRVTRNTISNTKNTQSKFIRGLNSSATSFMREDLSMYFPRTGMHGTETTFVSSPKDLVGITNANTVFSLDYYQGESRVAAGFATSTEGKIYDHSKTICDRLNGSKLLDVRTLNIRNHTLVSTKIQRITGEIEHSLTFSVKKGESENEIYSLWNIEDYPKGDYLNFQIWGGSISQVATISNTIIDNFLQEKPLRSHEVKDRIPTVFVQHGTYKNGKLILDIINKYRSGSMKLKGNLRKTEQSIEETMVQTVQLSGTYEEQVEIKTGSLFDIGISVSGENSTNQDALYLADGPWGIDYLEEDVMIESFEVKSQAPNVGETDNYIVERDAKLKGEIKGTINIFRNILAGELTIDASVYAGVEFNMKNDIPIEVVLVPKELKNWDNRLRITIPVSKSMVTRKVNFDQFVDALGKTNEVSDIRSIVFSVQGNYSTYKAFNLEVESLKIMKTKAFNSSSALDENQMAKVFNYPNPFSNQTTIELPNEIKNYTITVVDLLGKIVRYENGTNSWGKKVIFKVGNLSTGLYLYTITSDQNQQYTGRFVIQKE